MQMPASDFTVKQSTGAASVNAHSDLSPVASLTLAFKPASHTTAACTAGSETDYSGSLTGSVTLTTGLKGLTLSDTTASFKAPDTLKVDHACVPPLACILATWGSTDQGNPTAPVAAGITTGTPGP